MSRIRKTLLHPLAAMALCFYLVACDTGQPAADKSAVTADFAVQVGPRPLYLVDAMRAGPLKNRLQQCAQGPFYSTDLSIAHRGAPLQFPEHSRESYLAAARMGAGIIECDVTFTQDRELVCRHAQCDLHVTTDILERPNLAAKCSQPFTPADPVTGKPAQARCCTSDITLEEFKSLRAKMDGANAEASNVQEYLAGTPDWRTNLYSADGTVMSFADYVELVTSLGLKLTPELKASDVPMPFAGDYSQRDYAQQLVDTLQAREVAPENVFLQSFNLDDVHYWIDRAPAFGRQAVYLDDRVDAAGGVEQAIQSMPELAAAGVNYIAPPLWALVALNAEGEVIPSDYAWAAKTADIKILTWSLERSGLVSQNPGYYFQSVADAMKTEGDIYRVLDVLVQQVGVTGVFSDWPATVTYYANCVGRH